MTAKEGILTVCVVFLICLLSCIVCFEQVQRKADIYELKILHSKISQLEEQNKSQDSMIGAIIKTEAMRGTFDKEESK